MINNLVELFKILLDGDLKRSVIGLLFFSLFNSVLQAVGLFSTLPYLTLVLNPDLVTTEEVYRTLHLFFGLPPINQFLLIMGLIVVLLIVVSNLAFFWNVKLQMKLLVLLQVKQSDLLLRNYLANDYTFFLHNNANDLSKRLLNDSFTVVDQVVFSVFNIITYGSMIIIIAALLFFVNFYLTILSVLVVGLFYGVFYVYTRKLIRKFSERKFKYLKLRFKVVNELFKAIKDVKVNSLEGVFRSNYIRYEEAFFENHAQGSLLSSVPGLGMDVVVFGGIVCATLIVLFSGEGIQSVLPLLMTFALAVYKIKPHAQMLFKSINLIQISSPSLAIIVNDLRSNKRSNVRRSVPDEHFDLGDICLDAVSYQYPTASAYSVRDVSMVIKPNSTTALVGRSGAGKTTIADIILGLLKPNGGRLYYGDVEINESSIATWNSMVGYVPQQITLLDTTIAENVALGTDKSEIQENRVYEALVTAGLKEFIGSQPDGIWAEVGDNGVRISGGQKQRIGIARALYKAPKVLILDESTSALDGITEEGVMRALRNIAVDTTIILIAHRFSTIRSCDNIILFNKGRIMDQGSYEALMERSEEFRRLSKETI